MTFHSPTESTTHPAETPPARPAGWMTRRHVLALSAIALLAIVGLAAFLALAATHERALEVVKRVEQQRLLSQQIALYVDNLVDGDCRVDRPGCITALTDAISAFRLNHDGLAPPAVSALHDMDSPSLHERVSRYATAAQQVVALPAEGVTPDHPAVRYVLSEGLGPLLEALDGVTRQSETEADRAYAILLRLEIVVVLLTLLTLALQTMLVFRPMAPAHSRPVGPD